MSDREYLIGDHDLTGYAAALAEIERRKVGAAMIYRCNCEQCRDVRECATLGEALAIAEKWKGRENHDPLPSAKPAASWEEFF